jgi:hypothetical protein
MPKVNNHPLGENSPNLVTLFQNNLRLEQVVQLRIVDLPRPRIIDIKRKFSKLVSKTFPNLELAAKKNLSAPPLVLWLDKHASAAETEARKTFFRFKTRAARFVLIQYTKMGIM